MRLLELHTGVDWLGQALQQEGHEVLQLVPRELVTQRRAQAASATVHGIDHWADRSELEALSALMPTLDGVVTIDEGAMNAAAYLRELRHLPGLSVQDADACTSKDAGKRRLRQHGITVTEHRVADRIEELADKAAEIGYPVVVKPDRGAGATRTFRIDSAAQLAQMIARRVFHRPTPDPTGRFRAAGFDHSLSEAGRIVIEAYVEGDEFWCDLLRHGGRTLLAAPGRYNTPLLQSLNRHQWDTLLPLDDPDAHDIIERAEVTADALAISTGTVHVEMFRSASGWVVGEAAARPGGGGIRPLYALQHDADIELAVAKLSIGERPDLAPNPHYPVLTNLVIAAPPGTVTTVATARELCEVTGVVDAHVNLRVGEPTPGAYGSLSGAGRVTIASRRLEHVDADVGRVLRALRLRIEGDQPTLTGAAW
jgi:biotin carboxylase